MFLFVQLVAIDIYFLSISQKEILNNYLKKYLNI